MGTSINLLDDLARGLAEYGYSIATVKELAEVGVVGILTIPRRGMVTYACAVAQLPDGAVTVDAAWDYLARLRGALNRRYASFPYWKEVGTYTVLLATPGVYEKLHEQVPHLIHRTGLHTNILLGTVLADERNGRTVGASTWGLFYSGRHYGAIKAIVDRWCDDSLVRHASA